MRWTGILCALAFSCGGGADHAAPGAPTEEGSGPGGATAGGGSAPADPADRGEGCPPTLATAEGAPCATGGVPPDDCGYGDGHCRCGEQPVCSGAEREPAPMERWVWVCERPPPAVREDGCPGAVPGHGTDCDRVGRECTYGDCCVSSVRCTAEGWSAPGPTDCPP